MNKAEDKIKYHMKFLKTKANCQMFLQWYLSKIVLKIIRTIEHILNTL